VYARANTVSSEQAHVKQNNDKINDCNSKISMRIQLGKKSAAGIFFEFFYEQISCQKARKHEKSINRENGVADMLIKRIDEGALEKKKIVPLARGVID